MGQRERTISLVHEGTSYNLTPGDFTALDDMALYRATGMTLADAFGFGGKVPALAAVAGLVWRYRVGAGEDVTWRQVAETFTYADLQTVSDEPRDDAPKD